MKTTITLLTSWLSTLIFSSVSQADAALEHFEKKIRPVLVQQCYRCHSVEKKQRGGLVLDSRKAMLQGGDSGASLVPGNPKDSLLMKALHYNDPDLQMPPKGKLDAQVLRDFEKWITDGAVFPGGADVTSVQKAKINIEAAKQNWPFTLPVKKALPDVQGLAEPRTGIDHFILARLAKEGFKPAELAKPEVLIRRLHFDLIGIPPTVAQIDQFQKEAKIHFDRALTKLVDELLASPHFGERWGRHWLDVARYADSTGGGRTLLLKNAWKYRDYVIQAFNDDKPYNRFLLEQLAGDLLKAKSKEEQKELLTATAFLALGPTNYELQDKTVLEMDVIDEQLDTIGKSVLGLTIGCARCHDHKFDPIPQNDYYALAGIFRSTQTLVHNNVSKWVERPLPVSEAREQEIKRFQDRIAIVKKQIQLLKKKTGKKVALSSTPVSALAGIVIDDTKAIQKGPWKPSTFNKNYIGKGYIYDDRSAKEERTLRFEPKLPKAGRYEVRIAYTHGTNRASNAKVTIHHANGQKTVTINQRQLPPIDNHFVSVGLFEFNSSSPTAVVLSSEKANGVVIGDAVQFLAESDPARKPSAEKVVKKSTNTQEQKKKLAELEKELKRLNAEAPKRPIVMSVNEGKKIADCPLCIRGNIHNPGDAIPRGFLSVLTPSEGVKLPTKESGRRQLAEWLTAKTNPLTARVFVNRVWHHLFGQGLVRTVDNFGKMGEKPSHPELLDYLSVEFVEDGWSIKGLIRRIVHSRTYLQSSDPLTPTDTGNRLLARQNHRRLPAEAIRDSILAISGQLDRHIGGASIKPKTTIEYGYKFDDVRRSVYTPVFRNTMMELFEVFDVADPNLVMGRRNVSTTSTQALFLMNSPFVMAQAKEAAQKLSSSATDDVHSRIELAYRQTLGREPTAREVQIAESYLQRNDKQSIETWTQLYQVLFASVDFRYVK